MTARLRALLCALALFALPAASNGLVPGHEVDIQFGPGGAGPDRDHTSWTVAVQRLDDPKAAYYWAVMLYFQHAPKDAGAYAGLQPNGNRIGGGTGPLALFSVFGPDTTRVSGECESGADEGEGQSCRMPYKWSVGRTYRFDVSLVSRDARNATWVGTVTDTLARTKATIAQWKIPVAWGMLSTTTVVFAEYYDEVDSCDSQPYAIALFGAPVAYDGGAPFPPEPANTPDLPSKCNAHVRVIRSGSGYLLTTGVPR
jgi:hypothetical protein